MSTVTLRNRIQCAKYSNLTLPVYAAGAKQRLVLEANPKWRQNPSVQEYARTTNRLSSDNSGYGQFTITHPEDVAPGLTVADILFSWITDYTRITMVDTGGLPILPPFRGPTIHHQFKLLSKAVLGSFSPTVLDVGFLKAVEAGANPLVPSFILDPQVYITSLSWDGAIFNTTGTFLQVGMLNFLPSLWQLEFQTDLNATWRQAAYEPSGAGTETFLCTWSVAEQNKPQLNVTLRPFWNLDPTQKGTSRTYLIT